MVGYSGGGGSLAARGRVDFHFLIEELIRMGKIRYLVVLLRLRICDPSREKGGTLGVKIDMLSYD